jgi:hypothetical protein
MRSAVEMLDDDALTILARGLIPFQFKKTGPEGDPAPVQGRCDPSKNELQT